MADLQSLNLRHSTWSDAQILITRWGKYSRYEGICDASFCRYIISLESPESKLERVARKHTPFAFLATPLVFTSLLVGGRGAVVKANFVVQDSVVVRKGAVFTYEMSSLFHLGSVYELIATSRASSRLSNDGWSFTFSKQLAKHPFYKVEGPGGCTFCMMVNVAFTPDTPSDQVRALTTFNLSCLTHFFPCKSLEDIYPVSAEWNLYPGAIGEISTADRSQQDNESSSSICDVPIFALSRESVQIFAVTVIDRDHHALSGNFELPSVRLDSVLKEQSRYQVGDILHITSVATDQHLEMMLTPDRRFLAFSFEPQEDTHTLELERCSIIPDTPENRAQIQLGIAQNETLRYPDPRADWFIPE